jgi:PLP dependent protein
MSVRENLNQLLSSLPAHVTLVAVSKTKPAAIIQEAYAAGHRIFGENKVQELVPKYEQLPKDIAWHLIGHLQSNKVKYIAPFVHLIHSVDSLKLLAEIDKQAQKNNRVIDCLLQVHIASEETKFGLSTDEVMALLQHPSVKEMKNVCISGLMGMATNTDNQGLIRKEFSTLKKLFDLLSSTIQLPNFTPRILSMGMSSDYKIAVEEGSTLVRIGSTIFGNR